MSGKTKKKSLLGKVSLSFVMLIFALLGTVSIAVAFVNPSKVPFVGFFALLFVPLIVVNAILLVWGLVRLKRTTIITALFLALAAIFIPRYFKFGHNEPAPEKSASTISVLSWNVGKYKCTEEGYRGNFKKICHVIDTVNADIVCLQESSAALSGEIQTYFSKKYKVARHTVADGLLIMSRYKLIDDGRIDFPASTNGVAYADYNISGKAFRIYDCHLESFGQSPYKLLSSIFHLERNTIEEKGVQMQKSQSRRSSQIDSLCAHVAACGKKNVVCGDFNDTPLSYSYSRIRRDHKDAFRKVGHGWGGTFRFMWPLLRIDYFFSSSSVKPLYYDCLSDIEYSDHYPIIAYFNN